MRCFECGGEVIQTVGSVRMTKKDGTPIIFEGIPLSQCHQCGEQYIPGKWAEKIGNPIFEIATSAKPARHPAGGDLWRTRNDKRSHCEESRMLSGRRSNLSSTWQAVTKVNFMG